MVDTEIVALRREHNIQHNTWNMDRHKETWNTDRHRHGTWTDTLTWNMDRHRHGIWTYADTQRHGQTDIEQKSESNCRMPSPLIVITLLQVTVYVSKSWLLMAIQVQDEALHKLKTCAQSYTVTRHVFHVSITTVVHMARHVYGGS